MIKKTRLFTPGPTPLLPEAMAALAQSEVHHRTAGFQAVYQQVLQDLRYFFGTRNDVLLFTSSGTGAMEAAVSNLFSAGDRVVVASAGKFGERWVEICRAFGLQVEVVEAPYGEPVSPEAVRAKMGGASGLFFQASETSTGVAHDVKGLAAAGKDAGALVIVDAITGLGTMDLEVDGWGLDVVIGGSQKSLAIPPGLAFASVSAAALERSARTHLPRYYFSYAKEKAAADKGDASWTPSTALVLAMAKSLEYVRTLGRENLIANAARLAEATRAAAVPMHLRVFASRPSPAVTALCPPKGLDAGKLIAAMSERFGIILADGQGSMKGKIFRLAHLGYYDFPELAGCIASMEIVLNELGYPCELGAGVRAAQAVFETTDAHR